MTKEQAFNEYKAALKNALEKRRQYTYYCFKELNKGLSEELLNDIAETCTGNFFRRLQDANEEVERDMEYKDLCPTSFKQGSNRKKKNESFLDYLRRISPKWTIVSELWGGNVIIYEFDMTKVKEEDALFFIKCMLKKEIFTSTYKENKIYKFSVDSLLDQYNEDKVVSVWIDDEEEQNPSGLRYTDI